MHAPRLSAGFYYGNLTFKIKFSFKIFLSFFKIISQFAIKSQIFSRRIFKNLKFFVKFPAQLPRKAGRRSSKRGAAPFWRAHAAPTQLQAAAPGPGAAPTYVLLWVEKIWQRSAAHVRCGGMAGVYGWPLGKEWLTTW